MRSLSSPSRGSASHGWAMAVEPQGRIDYAVGFTVACRDLGKGAKALHLLVPGHLVDGQGGRKGHVVF